MLYYQDDLWYQECNNPSDPRPCRPLSRVNHTAFTDFNPVTWGQPNLTEVGGIDGDGTVFQRNARLFTLILTH